MIPYIRPEAPPILDPDDVVILGIDHGDGPDRAVATLHDRATGRVVVIGDPDIERLREAPGGMDPIVPFEPPRIDHETLRRLAAGVSPPKSPPNRAMRREAEQQKRRGGR